MTSTESKTIADWLRLLVEADPADRRTVAIRAGDAGYALTRVVCVLHGGTFNGAYGVYRHMATLERDWRKGHPNDELPVLHPPGSLRAALADDAPPPVLPWSTSGCRSCGARIVWAITSSGKRMPVDAASSPIGNIMLVSPDGSIEEPPSALVLHTEADMAGVPPEQLHLSHFVTCPKAANWRRSP
jgi:hypothetical protein